MRSDSGTSEAFRRGMTVILPMLIGVVPFGLVAGVTPVAQGLGTGAAVGFSTIVFAGASQLASIDVLGSGGTAVVAALAACTINLRILLYSASIAPYFAQERFGRRMLVAYLLTDQAYAVSIVDWAGDPTDSTNVEQRRDRLAFFLGAGLTLWTSWQLATIAGALVGNSIPDDVPLEFAVPLVFMVLLIPTLDATHAVVAAVVGGVTTVVALQLGVGPLSVMVGALCGIAAGAVVDRDEDIGAGIDSDGPGPVT